MTSAIASGGIDGSLHVKDRGSVKRTSYIDLFKTSCAVYDVRVTARDMKSLPRFFEVT